MSKNKKIFLIDGNGLAYRAFYALPPLTNSKGEPTGAVYGFTQMLLKLIDENPYAIIATFDKKGPTFRHEEYDKYKAQRPSMPEDLVFQLPLIKEVISALGIPIFEKEGYEADDLIGTIARLGEKAGYEVYIVTGDRDALQLVSPQVKVLLTQRGITDMDLYDEEKVVERFGILPRQIPDFIGLKGDTSDNIPGVPGVGEKTASDLIKRFDSLEKVLENISQVPGKKRRENLRAFKDQAILSKRLATIIRDIPIEIDFEKIKFNPENKNTDKLLSLFERLEFKQLIKRLFSNTLPKEDTKIVEASTNIKHISTSGDIKELKSLIDEKRESSFVILKDKGHPIRSIFKKIILDIDENYWILDKEFFKKSKEIWEHNTEKNSYNIKDAYIYFQLNDFKVESKDFDPMIASYLLDPGKGKYPLEDITFEHLKYRMGAYTEEIEKGIDTVKVIHRLKKVLLRKLEEFGLKELFYNIEMPLSRVLAKMELNGIKLDVAYLHKMKKELENKISSLQQEIYKLAGEEFNINSPKQLGIILFEKLGYPVIKKTQTGYSTDISVLETLAKDYEIAEKIIAYRQLTKLLSTYVDALIKLVNERTKRIHTTYNQTGTATGRLSSSDPNLQNIPIRTELGKDIRRAFISEEGNLLYSFDYSQIELRILAHMSGDKNLIDAFIKGKDIHTITASEIFGVPEEKVTSNMRRAAKAVNFGIIYGISDYGLSQNLGIERKEAKEYIERYFERYPKVKEFIEELKEKAKENGYVTTLFNRRRYLPGINSKYRNVREFSERAAVNTPIQGSAADLIKVSMIKVQEFIEKKSPMARLILQIHDELLIEAPKEDKDVIINEIKDIMENCIKLKVPLKVDIKIGTNWRDMIDI